MKPTVPIVLIRSSERILTDIAPQLNTEYAVGSASVIGLMMLQTATEFDRAVENLVKENEAMRAIFADAVPHVADSGLRERLDAAAQQADTGLRVSALETSNEALKALLIDLHAHVENAEGSWGRIMEARIWAELSRAAEARRLPHPMAG